MGSQEIKQSRVVLDTNILISALLFHGPANRIHDLWRKHKIIFLVSREIIQEYIKVLSYPKFRLTIPEIKYLLEEEISPFVKMVKVHSNVQVVADDPTDNKFLSLALDGKADYLISGDKHLLDIKQYHQCKCLTLSRFLTR